MKRFEFDNRTAVITGAASGIGAALAAALAERGCHLAITDINAERLDDVADSLRRDNRRLTTHVFDIADRAAVTECAEEVRQVHGGADLLINNAGVGVLGRFEDVSEEDFDWVMNINLLGPIRMTRTFLPLLQQSDDAHLVNISSIFGVIAPPGQTAYSASKFGLRGFSEALRHECEGTSVGVTTVHPGGVNTNIAQSSRAPADTSVEDFQRVLDAVQPQLVMPPAQAAEIILKHVERRRPRAIVGGDARFMALLQRLFPVSYWWWLQRGRDTTKMQLRRS